MVYQVVEVLLLQWARKASVEYRVKEGEEQQPAADVRPGSVSAPALLKPASGAVTAGGGLPGRGSRVHLHEIDPSTPGGPRCAAARGARSTPCTVGLELTAQQGTVLSYISLLISRICFIDVSGGGCWSPPPLPCMLLLAPSQRPLASRSPFSPPQFCPPPAPASCCAAACCLLLLPTPAPSARALARSRGPTLACCGCSATKYHAPPRRCHRGPQFAPWSTCSCCAASRRPGSSACSLPQPGCGARRGRPRGLSPRAAAPRPTGFSEQPVGSSPISCLTDAHAGATHSRR